MWCTKPSISFCLKQKQFLKKVLIYPWFHESDANKAGLRLNTLRNVAVKGSVMSAHGLSPCRTVYIYQNWRDVFSFMQYMPPLIHKERLSLSAYYSRLDWHSEREKKKTKKKEGDTGGNKREKVKSMARTRRERAFTPSADQLGEGRKWDEETGGWMCAYGRRGVVFHIHALLGVRTKRDSKTTAAGARPSRHERGGWRSRNRELVKSGAAGIDEGNEKEHKERRGEEEGQREWEWWGTLGRRGRRGESEGDGI